MALSNLMFDICEGSSKEPCQCRQYHAGQVRPACRDAVPVFERAVNRYLDRVSR